MTDVWSGTFTFLLTDIEGSTRLWEDSPTAMARALGRHDDIIAGVVGSHGGQLVRSRGEGDSAFAVFGDADTALRCAVELQRTLCIEPWPPSAPVRVRMALHSGPAQVRGGDYFGQGVNRAARLRSIAHGGQLIVSDDVHTATTTKLPAGAWLTDLGLHRLKDLARPERVWQVGHADLPSDFPPVRSLDARGHNLPVQLTAFVGREMEVLDVRKRIETTALLTLTGPGGIGKTRLALQAAAEAAEDFTDGVWLVELAGVVEPDLVPAAIARVLGIRDEAGRDLLQGIAEHVASQKTLLLLDNCEHVVEVCAHVAHDLLQRADALRILATSREPLRVYGEAIYAVPTLDVPDESADFPHEAMESEAVRLFVDRASLADREFVLGDQADDVVRICRRLEGIPLAIELAAALARTTPAREISKRLDDRLGSLADGPRTAPARQQTLRAAIDWSYDLLDENERLVFERLAVFIGGFTAHSATSVAGDDSVDGDVVQVIDRLVHRSLLFVRGSEDDVRYRMLDTVREYGLERARSRGDLQRFVDKHIAWAVALTHEAADAMRTSGQSQALGGIDKEIDNLRAAMGASLEGTDHESASRMCIGLFNYWFIRGHFKEARATFERLLETFPESAHRSRLLDVATSLPLLEEAVALTRAANDRPATGIALTALAAAAVQSGRLEDSKNYASEALTILRMDGPPSSAAQALNILGVAATMEGEDKAALNYYEDALAVSREAGMKENVAKLLMNLGNMAIGRSDYRRAREYYEECRENALAVNDNPTASGALTNLGVVAKATGDLAVARRCFTEALAEKRRIGDGRGLVVVLQGIGDVDRREGKLTDARRAIAESLELCVELPDVLGAIQGLEALASICADESETAASGLRFAAAAEAVRISSHFKRSAEDTIEFERSVATMREVLRNSAADAAWAQGSSMAVLDAAAEGAVHARLLT